MYLFKPLAGLEYLFSNVELPMANVYYRAYRIEGIIYMLCVPQKPNICIMDIS